MRHIALVLFLVLAGCAHARASDCYQPTADVIQCEALRDRLGAFYDQEEIARTFGSWEAKTMSPAVGKYRVKFLADVSNTCDMLDQYGLSPDTPESPCRGVYATTQIRRMLDGLTIACHKLRNGTPVDPLTFRWRTTDAWTEGHVRLGAE